MERSYIAEEFDLMYKSLTDPEEIQKAIIKTERDARLAARRSDTGL